MGGGCYKLPHTDGMVAAQVKEAGGGMSLMERVQLKLESEKIAEQKAKEQKQESFDAWKR